MIKYLLYFFNIILAIIAIITIIAGAIVIDDIASFKDFLDGQILSMPIILIVTGVLVFIIAVFGCYGAVKSSYCALMTFGVLLMILFVVQFGIGIAATMYRGDFQEYINETLTASLQKYHDSTGDKLAWKNLQNKLECCGVNGPGDWKAIKPYVLPNSCCHATRPGVEPPTEEQCRIAKITDAYVYQMGCLEELTIMVSKESNKLIGFGFGIAIFEIVGIILACWLAQNIKED